MRAKSAQAVAVLVRKFLGELRKWCASFWVGSSIQLSFYFLLGALVIQVDIGGHPPFSTGSKLFSGNFGNLLFLAVFNYLGHFEGLNEFFFQDGAP